MKDKQLIVFGHSAAQSPLPGVWPSTHRALLPVCGKPLIIHQIEQMTEAAQAHIRIARHPGQHAIQTRLGNGEEWGVTLRYSDLHPRDLLAEALANDGRCRYLNSDELTLCSEHQMSVTPHTISDVGTPQIGDWERANDGLCVGVPSHVWRTQSPQALHDLNMQVLTRSDKFTIPGVRLHRGNAFCDWQSHLSHSAYVGENVFIGKQVCVDQDTRLEANCALSNGVFIGAGCHLQNVTVLPNTSIEAGTRLANAIVTPEGVFPFQQSVCQASPQVSRCRANQSWKTGLPNEALLPAGF